MTDGKRTTDGRQMADAKQTTEAKRSAPAKRAKRPAAKARIAAVGIGATAMAGLVANMEIAQGQTPSAVAGPAISPPSVAELRQQRIVVMQKAQAAKPIVLTPHTIVHTVGGQSSGGGGYVSSGYAAAAPTYVPAPAAAPVASTGGSRP